MRTHAPLPWAVEECGGDGYRWWIVDAEGVPLGGTLAKVDADNIVLACNAFVPLAAFAEAYRRSLSDRYETDLSADESELLNMADAALAKARGEA